MTDHFKNNKIAIKFETMRQHRQIVKYFYPWPAKPKISNHLNGFCSFYETKTCNYTWWSFSCEHNIVFRGFEIITFDEFLFLTDNEICKIP